MAPPTTMTSGQLPMPTHCQASRPPPRHRLRQPNNDDPGCGNTAVTTNQDHQVSAHTNFPLPLALSTPGQDTVAMAPATTTSAASYQCPPIARPLILHHVTVLDKPQQPNDNDPGPSAIVTSPRMTTRIPASLTSSPSAGEFCYSHPPPLFR